MRAYKCPCIVAEGLAEFHVHVRIHAHIIIRGSSRVSMVCACVYSVEASIRRFMLACICISYKWIHTATYV